MIEIKNILTIELFKLSILKHIYRYIAICNNNIHENISDLEEFLDLSSRQGAAVSKFAFLNRF